MLPLQLGRVSLSRRLAGLNLEHGYIVSHVVPVSNNASIQVTFCERWRNADSAIKVYRHDIACRLDLT